MTAPARPAAGTVVVRPVQGRAELETFIRLPFRLYADDPAWVPPLDADVRGALDPKHPFHLHADVQPFLAWRDGRAVGRIVAIHNRTYVEFHEQPVGAFGLFECEEDEEAARELLATVEEWLRERGLTSCQGPFNFSTNDELWSPGILLEGFERPPIIMMAHGRPYYARLVEAAGYAKVKDLLAIWVDIETAGMDRLGKSVERIRKRSGITLRPIEMRHLNAEIERILGVYNSAWERNWGFVPMSPAEIDHMAKALKPVVNPELCLLAEKDGETIGFALGLLDYNQVLRHLGGKLFPIGFLKFLWYRRRISSTRVLTLGIRPGFRNRGIEAVMYYELFLAGDRAGAGRGECSWILEDNLEMLHGLERLGGTADKRYRVYGKDL